MKRLLTASALAVIAGTFAFGNVASAQDRHYDRGYHSDRGYDRHDNRHDDDRRDYNRHDDYRRDDYHRGHDRGYPRAVYYSGWHDRSDWRRGGYVARDDWDRGYTVDYRRNHLRRPPYGYEWRRVDDNYVLAAVASGLIASIIIGG